MPQCSNAVCHCGQLHYNERTVVPKDEGSQPNEDEDNIYTFIYGHEPEKVEYRPVDSCLCERVVKRAKKEIADITLQSSKMDRVAKFDSDEIQLGRLLGTGGFSSCYEVSCFKQTKATKYTREEQTARDRLTETARKKNSNEGMYALKHLRRKLVDQPKKFANGAIDLAVEAHFLASLDHPNILNIRGICATGEDGYAGGRHDGFFIITDRLKETLEDRIITWRKQLKRLKRPIFGRLFDKKGKKIAKLMAERLQAAHEIASAIAYLHSRNLIFRDLKPANIGFDMEGKAKLFDFGLCREMPADGGDLDSLYKMSGNVGTTRFMSPEVKKKQDYNQKADVYSYAMVMYEILSLNQTSSANRQSSGNSVLETCSCWPPAICDMLQRAWSHEIAERPTMKEISRCIRVQLTGFTGGSVAGSELISVAGQNFKSADTSCNSTIGTFRTLSIGAHVSQSTTRTSSVGQRLRPDKSRCEVY